MFKRGQLHRYGKQVGYGSGDGEGLFQENTLKKDGKMEKYDKESFRGYKIDFKKYYIENMEINIEYPSK